MTQPAMASRLARRKLAHIENSGADLVAAANAGCILHLRQFAALEKRQCKIVHPIDLLDQAYRKSASRAR
jgi:glycolate oxidase iron-sulfur subunit